ncbi:(2Fe-2S)-binding protein [Ornithinimicrobium cavernae]|uniref:(2Fe-2S)-binding protein n=1 Tax=Ornithinimicrobium cavernae TaxID=2666047 RepID=UPI000D68633A|nr:(2Fe-2S)-binding protein [Ornithinimicrobium cavernae]
MGANPHPPDPTRGVPDVPSPASPGIPPGPAERARDLTALGGFAVWQVERDGLVPLPAALRADALLDRFAATRAGLAAATGLPTEDVLTRTAVSAAQVGLVSRLWSVALASVALHSWVPDLRAEQLLVAGSHRNPSPMALKEPTAGHRVHDTSEAVTVVGDLVVHGAVADVTEACREHGSTSANVLVSNAASSLVAAARVIGRAVPAQSAALDRLARSLLELPWLAAGGGYRPADGTEEFKRTGCCLYYRLPGHGLCPDCVLVRPGRPASAH